MLQESSRKEVEMADSGLFIGWGEIVRGRETEAVEHFNATIDYFSGCRQTARSKASSLCP